MTVTYAILGAGQRGTSYADWIVANPDRARVVAVADPRPAARERVARGGAREFASWQELADAPRLADVAIVATLDADHVEPAVALARKGYHLMVEKPMAPNARDCERIVEAVHAAGVLFAVCHVLRYRPYNRVVKDVLDAGRIGEVVSVQHLEPVGFWHFAHSYVRGNWRRADTSTFSLMSKSCHDIDWLRHVVGRPIRRVSSFGSLRHFRRAERPDGAGERCLSCAVEQACPYSAKRIYLGMLAAGRTGWPVNVLTDDVTEAGVTQALRDGPYGRCVYTSDNDVVDHQVVAMDFDGGVTATFTMAAFTPHADRRTQILGTRGFLDGTGSRVLVHDFRTDTATTITTPSDFEEFEAGGTGTGHGGGDAGLMDAFTTAVATGDPRTILSGPDESLETHLAVFAAERARLSGTVEEVRSA